MSPLVSKTHRQAQLTLIKVPLAHQKVNFPSIPSTTDKDNNLPARISVKDILAPG